MNTKAKKLLYICPYCTHINSIDFTQTAIEESLYTDPHDPDNEKFHCEHCNKIISLEKGLKISLVDEDMKFLETALIIAEPEGVLAFYDESENEKILIQDLPK